MKRFILVAIMFFVLGMVIPVGSQTYGNLTVYKVRVGGGFPCPSKVYHLVGQGDFVNGRWTKGWLCIPVELGP